MGKEHPILVGTGIKHFSASQIFIFLLPCLHSLLSSLLSVFVSHLQKWMFPLKSHWFGICCQQCPEPDAPGGGKPLPGLSWFATLALEMHFSSPKSKSSISRLLVKKIDLVTDNFGSKTRKKISSPSPASHLSVQCTLTGLGREWNNQGLKNTERAAPTKIYPHTTEGWPHSHDSR